MSCEIILKKIKFFLDDLLEEEDYQQVCRHLGQCARCQTYAASIGSLSYRVHTLGDVPSPPDMLSTVLYSIKNTDAPQSSPAAKAASVSVGFGPFWTAVLAVFLISIGAISFIFFWQKKPVVPAAVSMPAPAAGRSTATVKSDVIPPPQAHLHFHLTASSRDELTELLDQMELVAYYQSPRLVIVNVPKKSIREFIARLGTLSGVLQEFGEMDGGSATEDTAQVSVYLD